ncbi:MAG: hypothetical protein ACLPQY_13370 [Streptosporangiaceae bacterium]
MRTLGCATAMAQARRRLAGGLAAVRPGLRGPPSAGACGAAGLRGAFGCEEDADVDC